MRAPRTHRHVPNAPRVTLPSTLSSGVASCVDIADFPSAETVALQKYDWIPCYFVKTLYPGFTMSLTCKKHLATILKRAFANILEMLTVMEFSMFLIRCSVGMKLSTASSKHRVRILLHTSQHFVHCSHRLEDWSAMYARNRAWSLLMLCSTRVDMTDATCHASWSPLPCLSCEATTPTTPPTYIEPHWIILWGWNRRCHVSCLERRHPPHARKLFGWVPNVFWLSVILAIQMLICLVGNTNTATGWREYWQIY